MSSPFTFTIPRAVVFSKEQMEKIEECLDELAKDTGAWSILLTDTTGQLIEIQGRIDEKRAEELAALIAGSYAASAEFIKILGKGKDVCANSLSHEATDYSIFSTLVDKPLILSVAFDNEVKVGVVRVLANQARHRLSEIVHEASLAKSDANGMNLRLVDEDVKTLVNEELEKLTEFDA
jgi:predicted regulator of Ras-like GTPase activity (Roadblock/LC7/MglB family)